MLCCTGNPAVVVVVAVYARTLDEYTMLSPVRSLYATMRTHSHLSTSYMYLRQGDVDIDSIIETSRVS